MSQRVCKHYTSSFPLMLIGSNSSGLHTILVVGVMCKQTMYINLSIVNDLLELPA